MPTTAVVRPPEMAGPMERHASDAYGSAAGAAEAGAPASIPAQSTALAHVARALRSTKRLNDIKTLHDGGRMADRSPPKFGRPRARRINARLEERARQYLVWTPASCAVRTRIFRGRLLHRGRRSARGPRQARC